MKYAIHFRWPCSTMWFKLGGWNNTDPTVFDWNSSIDALKVAESLQASQKTLVVRVVMEPWA